MKTLTIFLCLLGLCMCGIADSEAKRDPFKPFKELEPPKGGTATPLERYEISQLKLIGIIGSEADGYRGLVEDSAGEGFIITVGSLVGSKGSSVKEIRRDKVVILEKYRDYMGREKVREVVWRLSNPMNQRTTSKAQRRQVSR